MKVSPANTGDDARYHLKGEPASSSYTVEGLETLVMNGRLGFESELARVGEDDYRPVHEWPFGARLFPLKLKFGFKPGLAPRAVAPPPLEITSAAELRELIRRDPHDLRVILLLNHVKERHLTEGRPVEELLEEHFAHKRAELAAKPKRRVAIAQAPEAPPPPMKNVTPPPPGLGSKLKNPFKR
jgi:hypothetical protein